MQITRKVVAVAAVGALVAAGSGAALARSGAPEAGERPDRQGPRWHHQRGPVVGLLETAAGYLELDRAELRDRLRDGSSLADVARAEGKSVDGLKAALRAELVRRLDARLDELLEREFRPRR